MYYCSMRSLILIFLVGFLIQSCETKSSVEIKPHWQQVNSPYHSSLRGIAAIDSLRCWLSGSNGKILLTEDAGKTWFDRSIPALDSLDFRDIYAWDENNAIVLSAGLPAVIAQTSNGGRDWIITYFNKEEGMFFDAIDFWDSKNGIAFSDAKDSLLYIMTTNDGGEHWKAIEESSRPKVYKQQGGFAASGTCMISYGKGKAIIGLGGPEASVFISEDYGQNWRKSTSPLDFGTSSKGNFSFSHFNNQLYVVGGDYYGDSLTKNSIAKSEDFGLNWELIKDTAVAGKYRSSIVQVDANKIITVSRTGASYSLDAGENWFSLKANYYSLSKGKDNSVWASGPNGQVAKLIW